MGVPKHPFQQEPPPAPTRPHPAVTTTLLLQHFLGLGVLFGGKIYLVFLFFLDMHGAISAFFGIWLYEF